MVAPSVASRAVAALEADGLVERHADPEDARACLIGITDLGRERLADHRRYTLQRVVAALPDWDDEEAALATQVLSRLDLSLAAAPTAHPLPAPKVLAGSTAITLLDQMESDARMSVTTSSATDACSHHLDQRPGARSGPPRSTATARSSR